MKTICVMVNLMNRNHLPFLLTFFASLVSILMKKKKTYSKSTPWHTLEDTQYLTTIDQLVPNLKNCTDSIAILPRVLES